MGAKLEQLRAAKIAHPKHKFSPEEEKLIEGLSDAEVRTLISVKQRLGENLLKKKVEKSDTHPNTLLL